MHGIDRNCSLRIPIQWCIGLEYVYNDVWVENTMGMEKKVALPTYILITYTSRYNKICSLVETTMDEYFFKHYNVIHNSI